MDKIIGAIIALGGLLVALISNSKEQAGGENIVSDDKPNESPVSLNDLYQKWGDAFNVDWRLLKAIAIVESSERPNAENPSDPSVGLMQILCVPDGKGGCKNDFHIMGWPPKNKEELFNPDYNVMLGAQILEWNLRTYGYPKGIAVYNSWSARLDPEEGPFRNQGYVDKVLANYGGRNEKGFPNGIGA